MIATNVTRLGKRENEALKAPTDHFPETFGAKDCTLEQMQESTRKGHSLGSKYSSGLSVPRIVSHKSEMG